MRILLSGACGFVGSTIARTLLEAQPGLTLVGCDNFSRPGSQTNAPLLQRLGVCVVHADVRLASDFEPLPPVDWVIDCAANPSVLAGVDGRTSSRQVVEHNLQGTINLLEFCRRHQAGFILLSTSRVYAIEPLASLPMQVNDGAFVLDSSAPLPAGIGPEGIAESFSTAAPVSLYGATKLASEALALEYAASFSFPAYVDRCGVLAGAGQFGRPDQGIFSYWIHSWRQRRTLAYLGFGGTGHQVRDCLHPADLVPLLWAQMSSAGTARPRILNVGGGIGSARSLWQLSRWCAERFGEHAVASQTSTRQFDLPWVVLDATAAREQWAWRPQRPVEAIWNEIADHADAHPHWLELSAGT